MVTETRRVLAIMRMTVHNGPGLRTLVQFKGCPLRCQWCSTPESQRDSLEIAVYPAKCIHCGECIPHCSSQAIYLTAETVVVDRTRCDGCCNCIQACHAQALVALGPLLTVEDIVAEVKRDVVFYKKSRGGVTLSGGEPLFDYRFTRQLLEALHREGISVGMDTSGYVPWERIEPLLPFIEFFLWDVKHMQSEEHMKLTGVANDLILRNARAVAARNVPIYLRVPLIPGSNDSEENIVAICKFARELPSLVEVDLLPLHHLGKARYQALDRRYLISNKQLYTDSALQKLKSLVESQGLVCQIVS